jgi:hypothetical protein
VFCPLQSATQEFNHIPACWVGEEGIPKGIKPVVIPPFPPAPLWLFVLDRTQVTKI